jgi:hypothetical protein
MEHTWRWFGDHDPITLAAAAGRVGPGRGGGRVSGVACDSTRDRGDVTATGLAADQMCEMTPTIYSVLTGRDFGATTRLASRT